ncbi:LacI family transcriptional regulator [bacterium]|nr:LacI family transcriptional regulator [bacterium]
MSHQRETSKPARSLVAELAGVSEATVSRVFNTPSSVSQAKVELVLAAANKLGYIPDKNASALRRKGTGVILFLEKKVEKRYQWSRIRYYNWFYGDIIRSLSADIDKTMYQLRLYSVTSNEEIFELGKKKICDGIIGFDTEDQETATVLAGTGIPYVCCGHTEEFTANSCSTDNHKGGFIAAKYLYETGHRKPAYVTGLLDEVFSHHARKEGFCAGFKDCEVKIIGTDVGKKAGYETGKVLCKSVKKGDIDSIGVVNDLTAIGVIHALMEDGIRVPDDVSIIGYDNLPITLSLPFQFSSVELSLSKLYSSALKLLLNSIKTGKAIKHVIEPELIAGESVIRRET